MIQVIIYAVTLLLILLLLNSFLNHICGFDSSGNYSKVIEGTLTIVFLYLLIIALSGQSIMLNGIPFADKLDQYCSILNMYKEDFSVFLLECVELISLTFIISFVSNLIPSTFGGTGFTGKIIKNIIVILLGLLVNNYLIGAMKETTILSLVVMALQCFLSGAAISVTPAMLIGKCLKMHQDSSVVTFLVEKLPQTKIGRALSTSATNSLILVFSIMLFESQFGSTSLLVNQFTDIILMFSPLVIMLIGIRLIIKSITK